jgi:hypothetical protein
MTFPIAAFFLTAAYLASLVSTSQDNEPISVDFPTHNNVFRVRDNLCIKWTARSGDKTISRILLLENFSDPLDSSHIIATSVETMKEKYVWTIPDQVPSGYNCKYSSLFLELSGPF